MFSEFLKFFNRTADYNIYGNDYRTFIIAFGGESFGKGMFSVMDKSEALLLERCLSSAFPEYKGAFRLFAFDWMGRCFAVPSDNENKVLVFDPGIFDVYEIDLGLKDFVNKAIPVTTEECLSADAFIKWHEASGSELTGFDCAGYKVPLFLGGKDELDNFEVINMEKYWYAIAQAGKKLRFDDQDMSEETEENLENDDDFYEQQAREAEEFFKHQRVRALYIRKNTEKYLEKFKNLYMNDTKVSWNWCAFLFGGAWMLYRKLYICFILVYLISAVVGGAVGFALGLGLGMAGFSMAEITFFSAVVGVALMLMVMIITGMFCNHWYSKKIDKLVYAGETAETEEEREKIYKKGGVNIPLLIVYIVLGVIGLIPFAL